MPKDLNASPNLRVMTYNIHKGAGALGVKSVLEELRAAIRVVKADLVFLQEVMGHSEREVHGVKPLRTSQFEFLADSVWSHFAYGKNAIYSSGDHGNAVLSKYPIRDWENIDISTNRLERRGLLHGILQLPGNGILHVVCLHLNLLEGGRRQQIERLTQRVSQHVPAQEPLIVAGDFNDWRERLSEALKGELSLQEVGSQSHGRHLKTFPAWLPVLPLDRIYFRGLELVECSTLNDPHWSTLSDHQAVVADFKFPSLTVK